jgi:hypothetical protein
MPEATEPATNANPFKRRGLADNEVFWRPLHFVVQARTKYETTRFRGLAHETATASGMEGKNRGPARLEARLVMSLEDELHSPGRLMESVGQRSPVGERPGRNQVHPTETSSSSQWNRVSTKVRAKIVYVFL